MRLVLFSDDRTLYELCRRVLADHQVAYQQLILAEPELPLPEADFYIWDSRQAMDTGRDLAALQPSRHLLLVNRHDLAGPEAAKFLGTMVVLKPVTRAALAAWLDQAIAERATVARPATGNGSIVKAFFEANLRLQEYDQDRTEFLARAIHDFRAPLTATNGYCGLLLAGQLGPLTDGQKEVLSRTQNSLKRLSRLTSAMFQLTMGMRTQHSANLERGDIRECIDQALHELQPMAAERKIEVRTNLRLPPLTILFDHGQVVQVLQNLLENACKFTPKAGHIGISGYPYFWERRSNRVPGVIAAERRVRPSPVTNSFRVDVCNSGAVIQPELLNRLFEEHTSSRSRGSEPGGLGLAICGRIMQQHKGRIWAENRTEGPMVSFLLPAEPSLNGDVNGGAQIDGQQMKGVNYNAN